MKGDSIMKNQMAMGRDVEPVSSIRGGWTLCALIVSAVVLGAVVYGLHRSGSGASKESRAQAYQVAMAKAEAEKDSWPGSPEELIAQFWEAASRKDYPRLVILSPGSLESDYRKYYDQWTPSASSSVGKPEPHPQISEVTMYPTKVSFPGFPNKTVKMAVRKAADGRHIIDGRNTIWW